MNRVFLVLALTSAAACSANGAAQRAISIDDAQIGQSVNHFEYAGAWEHLSARSDGRFAGTSSRSHHAGDSVIFPFDGSAVRLYGVRGPNGGEATVAIDGRYLGTASFLAPQKVAHALVFESPPLASGTHTLGIVVKGDVTGSHRAYVNLDAAEVLPQQ